MNMQKYVALLRGINVGGNNTVEMGKLKKAFEALGHANVSTYINSGNVIFKADRQDAAVLAGKIEKVLEKTFGFAIKTLVRDAGNIRTLCKGIPPEWKNDTEMKTDVLFLWPDFDAKSSLKLIAAVPDIDRLKYIDGAIVWSVDRKDYAKSGMAKFIGTTLYKHMTARNVNTVRKLGELVGSSGK
jgi:uncharacterized protein (DUF1697 family)